MENAAEEVANWKRGGDAKEKVVDTGELDWVMVVGGGITVGEVWLLNVVNRGEGGETSIGESDAIRALLTLLWTSPLQRLTSHFNGGGYGVCVDEALVEMNEGERRGKSDEWARLADGRGVKRCDEEDMMVMVRRRWAGWRV